jgi:hypothetical protein
MQIRSAELFQRLEKMAQHYQNNVASNYLKAELANLPLTRRDWDEVEMITARLEIYRSQGFHLDELYLKLLSMAKLVHQARIQMAPGLKAKVCSRLGAQAGSNKLMAEMASANFLPNLAVLGDMVLDLYAFVQEEDTSQNQGKTRALASVPEAKEIASLLQA